jgi:hypothetical protein
MDLPVLLAVLQAGEQQTIIGVANAPLPVEKIVSKADRFKKLKNKAENQRLHRALKWRYSVIYYFL